MARRRKLIEYWVGEMDEHGDIIDYTYQDNNKVAATNVAIGMLDAGTPRDRITFERVTRWWWFDGTLDDTDYEDVEWGT
jgi:hypothetical protein